jgi:hypothetical protein
MAGTERFPTAEAGLAYYQAFSKRTRELHRKTMPTLRQLEREALEAEGVRRMSGGPQGKDELERAILSREFPVALLNEAIHAAYHKQGEPWEGCAHCHAVHS